ncbi:MAG: serine/threonine protein kinase [Myxococcales bacterium]|nr:serine/threonine protein kinase [Myxococcales bacterium]
MAEDTRQRRPRPDSAGTPEKPLRFGQYRLAGRIARGGMAEVFYGLPAADSPQDVLAIKCMRPQLAKQERFVEMFIREGRLAMMLEHDNIVRTVDVGDVDGRFYIAMRYVPGKDLNQILKRCQDAGRRVPVPHAIFISMVVSRALHYAHELKNPQGRSLNIVNRDVSPANIRVTWGGDVKLLDFGIAQAVMQVQSEIGILKGKFAYMSPEQIRGLPLDRRTDVFSSGIVLHEVLTCERLFRDDSEFALMEKVRRGEIKPPSAINKRVPPELDAIVMRALDRDPNGRFQSSLELAEALAPLLERYQFEPAELGGLARSLFPSDYRKSERLIERMTTSGQEQAPEGVPEFDDPTHIPVQKSPKPARSKPPPRTNRSSRDVKPAQPERRSTKAIWIATAVLLAGAVALLAIALR